MIPWYVNFIGDKGLFPNQHARVTGEFGSMLMIDGQRGYGQVIGHEAMRAGIGAARQHGVALVALRNAHHIGGSASGRKIAPRQGWCRSILSMR